MGPLSNMEAKVAKRLLLIVAIIATLIPAVFVLQHAGGIENWQEIPPRGTTDSLYYYARMHEVKDGYPFIGHPYLFEHRDEYSPTFPLPDIISAIPLIVGIPFDIAILINLFIWSFVFLLLAHSLSLKLGVSKQWAFGLSILLYLSSYSYMLRPSVMQIIFPLFLLYFIVLIGFIHEPYAKNKKRILSFVSAISFFSYSYLGVVAFLSQFFLLLWFLISRQIEKSKALFVSGVYTTLLLIPFFAYTLVQMKDSFYQQTVERVGLVYTHIPTLETFFFGRWIIIGLGALIIFWFLFSRKQGIKLEQYLFWFITGAALITGLFLNVLTGVEAFFSVHIGRFIILWTVLLLGVFLYEWYHSSVSNGRYTLVKHLGIACFVALLMIGAFRNLPRAFAFFTVSSISTIADIQEYKRPLSWLNDHASPESVIWSNTSIGDYIPIMTKHYTLFNSNAVLHVVSDDELEERYLLWSSLNDMTRDDIRNDFSLYGGAGPTQEQPLAINNWSRVCKKLPKFIAGGECPESTDAFALKGEEYFDELFREFTDVQERQHELLVKYNVAYLIVDTQYDNYDGALPQDLAVYADGRFLIFPVSALLERNEESEKTVTEL